MTFEKVSDSLINAILKDLTNVYENLLALSDDIWDSIDHNDNEKLENAIQFKKEFNKSLDEFRENSFAITSLISQFTGVKDEADVDTIVSDTDTQPPQTDDSAENRKRVVVRSKSENERLIQELDRSVAHYLGETFTYKRPCAIVFTGIAYLNLNTWKDLYLRVCKTLYAKDSALFKKVAFSEELNPHIQKPHFSADKNAIRRADKLADDVFVETNVSAAHIASNIRKLLGGCNISEKELKIYLRQDRNA